MSLLSALTGPIARGGTAISDAMSRLTSKPSSDLAQAEGATNTSSAGSSSSAGSTGSSSTDPSDPLGSESTFLTLLVSQLQNQDPLNPTDSNQFVSQLTSFSQLEQLINIDQNTTSMAASVSSAAPTPPASGTPASSGNTTTHNSITGASS
jgi:flagellar basal-body rod modification protein FlgD